ncbi:MAG: hypothetical protein KME13_13085 [Myxacorys californica WJT36-NPBG1]|jgi:hypothetical protein|nr:hypothetical protein [Myxacorys californica WJT36-NPBG1]
MGNPRKSRDRVMVTPFTGATIKYGFLTNTEAAARTALGQVAAAEGTAKLVFGANTPKPGRASKGGTNSYYSIEQRATLLAAKWNLSSPFVKPQRSSTKTKAVFVEVDTVKYAWKMPLATYTAIGADRANLGIQDCVATEKDYVTGTNFPRPQRARKLILVGTGAEQTEESYSTFVDDDAVGTGLPTGWTIINAGKQLVQ